MRPVPQAPTSLWTTAALCVVLLVPAAARSAGEEPEAAGGEETGEAAGGEETGAAAAAPEPVFPDPLLMRRALRTRNGGAFLTIAGAATFVVGFNVVLSLVRTQVEPNGALLAGIMAPSVALLVVGLDVGAPLWSVGGEMVRQLTRHTRGDEKLRRAVANDERYWAGRTMFAFGTSLAMSGGLGVTAGLLTLVGGIWVVQQREMLQESGVQASPLVIMAPATIIGVSTAMLITGLRLVKSGNERSRKVREAYDTALVLPLPTVDPAGGLGLALAGRF